jgi:hypothetical protein
MMVATQSLLGDGPELPAPNQGHRESAQRLRLCPFTDATACELVTQRRAEPGTPPERLRLSWFGEGARLGKRTEGLFG